jgi:hypothetical protein
MPFAGSGQEQRLRSWNTKIDLTYCFTLLTLLRNPEEEKLFLHCDDATRNNRLRNREDKATWNDEMLKQASIENVF